MNVGNIWLVTGREYTVRVRKRSFIITTLITPVLLGVLIALPVMITLWGGGGTSRIKIVDPTGTVMRYLENSDHMAFEEASAQEAAEAPASLLEDPSIHAVVIISQFDENNEVKVTSYSGEPLSMEIKNALKGAVGKAVEDRKLAAYDMQGLREIIAAAKTDIHINAITVGDDGSEKKDTVEIYMILSYLMSFLIYTFVFLFGTMVMRSVMDEKGSRVVEIIISSVDSIDLMIGKIVGVALVALTQFALWIILTMAVAGGISAFAVRDITEALQAGAADAQAIGGMEVIEMLQGINWLQIILCFLIYFLLGYLLYAAMFAAIGAACDSETDTNQLQMPVTVPLIIGLFIMLHTFEHPGSSLSFWASMIPWTSPMVMLARIPFGVVPPWQLILSMTILALTFAGTAWVSAKIYRTGILMYGKKTSFRDLLKWIKQQN